MYEETSTDWDGKTQLTHYEEADKYTLKIGLVDGIMNITLTILSTGVVYGR